MSDTTRLKLPLIAAQQAQKHVTHNEALQKLDVLVQASVLDKDLNTPPASPAEGDAYIVAIAASGDWAGQEGNIAAWQNGGWVFHTPAEGWKVWVADEDALYVHDGTSWVKFETGITSVNPVPDGKLGINTTADATNRLAVKSDAVLFSHDDVTPGSGDVRFKVNKAAATNTASLLFQDNWLGRAELGLAGDDDFHVKVSHDGSAWRDALHVDPATAAIAFPHTPLADNLLINGDLQINQRAFAGGTLSAGAFGFDRWRAAAGGATISVSGSTITLSGGIEQVLETPYLAGATITVSVEDLSGDSLAVDVEGVSATISPGAGRRGVSLVVPATSTGHITLRLTASSQASFSRIMLVRGHRVTPWKPRPPAMEKVLCQRYFQRISYRQWASITAARINWNKRVDFVLRYLQPMRTTPNISLVNPNAGNIFEVNAASGTTYQTTFDYVFAKNTHEATIALKPIGGDANKVAYVRCAGPQSTIHFDMDAEL